MRRNLLTTRCACGYEVGEKDVSPPIEPCKRPHFYGGAIDSFCDAACPECGKEYTLYLRLAGHGIKVCDMELREPKKTQKKMPKKTQDK